MKFIKYIKENKEKEEIIGYLLIVVAFLVLGYSVFAHRSTGKKDKPKKEEIEKVNLLNLKSKKQDSTFVKTNGEVEAKNSVDLKSEVSAQVREVYVDLGDKVYRGQTLVSFDSANAYSKLRQAQANLKSAKAKKEQLQAALQSKRSTLKKLQTAPRPEKLDEAQTKVENASEDLKSQRENLEETKQKAKQDLKSTLVSALNTAQLSIDEAKNILLTVTDLQYTYFNENDQTALKINHAKRDAIRDIWDQEDAGGWIEKYVAQLNGGLDREIDRAFDQPELNQTKQLLDETISGLNKVKILLNEIPMKSDFSSTDEDSLSNAKQTIRSQLKAVRNQKEAILTQQSANSSKIQQAKSKVTAAKNSLKSAQKSLATVRSGSSKEDIQAQKQAVEQAKANLKLQQAKIESAQADVLSARSSLSKRTITSPISGEVAELKAEEGELVSNSQLVAKIVNTDGYQVRTYLSSEAVRNIEVGSTSTIAGEYRGKVVNISPSLNSNNSKVETIISVDSKKPDLIAGNFVNLKIKKKKHQDSMLLPIESVSLTNTGSYVYIINSQNKVEEKKVETGDIVGNQIEIKSGLDNVAQIISSTRGLEPGDKVATK
ncbi:MAG: efflux RND transporter periplasmic adaptor subunit [Candidatus Magasanikbacteria bacterium]